MSNVILTVVFALIVGALVFGQRACEQAINEAVPSPCASTVVDGTRCVYCTGKESVAVSCDWNTRASPASECTCNRPE